MNNDDWADLISEIEKGNCILVLGPETSIIHENGSTRFSSEVLSTELADEISEMGANIQIKDLGCTSLIYNYEKKNQQRLRRKVKQFYQKNENEPNSIFDSLSTLPFPFIVNATPDNRITKSLNKQGKNPKEAFFNFRGENIPIVDWENDQNALLNPLVFYLYGSIENDDSLVITENDLLKFLVAIIKKDPGLQWNIDSEFKNKKKSFLFLGFGFKNWYLRILLFVLLDSEKNREREGLSFALEDFSLLPEDKKSFTSMFFKEEHNIIFADLNLQNFVAKLNEKYLSEVGAPKLDPAVPIQVAQQNAPKVFLCHASEDKKFAGKLFDSLKAKNVDPWLDKENLRGGDDWNDLIKETIKDVDYFIVLQSQSLLNKTIGYVNKEISLAKDRQLEFRGGLRFVIPIEIEKDSKIPDFKTIQSIDLTETYNIDELVKTIRLDQKNRQSYGKQ